MRQMHQQFQNTSLAFPRRFPIRFAASLLALLPVFAAHAASPAPTRTVLTAQGAGYAGTSVGAASGVGINLDATVRTATGSPVDAGTVDFVLANGQSLGSAPITAEGTATLALAQLPAGTVAGVAGDGQLAVTAVYHAPAQSSAFADSTSVPTAVASPQVINAVPDFTVTGNPTTVTTKQGSYGATVLTVSSIGNYAGPIQFSCSNLPEQVTCAFNPTQQALGANGSFVSTLELQTQAASGTASSSLQPVPSEIAFALLIPGALLLIGFGGRRREAFRGANMLGLLLLAGSGLGLSGCSQRYAYLHHAPPVAGGTPPGTYTIAIAVDGSQGSSVLEHTLMISLVVQ